MKKIMDRVKKINPLVHSITNYVTVNDCANITLASGASPIMADDIEEVEDIVSISKALILNIGTLNQRTIESMLLAGKKANELDIPVIFDPVGAGASKLRTDTTYRILDEIEVNVITGNISEIKTIYKGSGSTKGVDASKEDAINEQNINKIVEMAKELSRERKAIVSITGEIDIVTDGRKTYLIRNGHEIMPLITGSGCMLTSVIGGYIGANPDNELEAIAVAKALMGLAGEKAYRKIKERGEGSSSFRTYLIDYIYRISYEDLKEAGKIESI